ncbi:MAG: sigma-70 family RNA polymerase sigma factor [Polyangiaceae bacterium]|nr:sigma-70 family RNA polymerase sigma factor [Polyangiaceae bacterium]
MTRRRGRRPPGGPRDRGPVVYVADLDILAHEPLVRSIARAMGVSERHIPDVVQNALFSAWLSMRAGRFRMREGDSVDRALRAWMTAVAMNHAMNWQARASTRREILFDSVRSDLDDWSPRGVDPGPRYDAREVIRLAAERFPERLRPVLVLAMRGLKAAEIAVILDVPFWTAWVRLDEVRKVLAAIAEGEG